MVEKLSNLKPIELNASGGAEFELEMSLKDPTSKIFLYKVNGCTMHADVIVSHEYSSHPVDNICLNRTE